MAKLAVGISGDEASAIIQADSTSQGALIPRMTEAQRDAISNPATGLLIYNTDDDTFDFYDGANWITLGTASGGTAEIFFAAASMWPSTTSGAADPTKTEYATNDQDLYLIAFDQTTIEYAQFSVWMPDDWDAGTVTFKTVWTAASGTAAQTVEWNLEGRAYANDDAIDQAWGTAVEVSDALIATGDVHYTSESAAVTLAGTPAAGELVQFRAWRDATNDTLAADALLIGVKVYYGKS